MRSPHARVPHAIAALLLSSLCSVSSYSQSYLLCKSPSSRSCLAWILKHDYVEHDFNKMFGLLDAIGLCVLSASPISEYRRDFIMEHPVNQGSTKKSLNCYGLKFMGAFVDWDIVFETMEERIRSRRQTSFTPRGRYRGQTQSQYLSIDSGNKKDEGKAEAQSAADSSRASVSGNSGMGQAQSQSIYDPSCDDCNGKSDNGADNLQRESYAPTGSRVGHGKSTQPAQHHDNGVFNPSIDLISNFPNGQGSRTPNQGYGTPGLGNYGPEGTPSSDSFHQGEYGPGDQNYGHPNSLGNHLGQDGYQKGPDYSQRGPASVQHLGVGFGPSQNRPSSPGGSDRYSPVGDLDLNRFSPNNIQGFRPGGNQELQPGANIGPQPSSSQGLQPGGNQNLQPGGGHSYPDQTNTNTPYNPGQNNLLTTQSRGLTPGGGNNILEPGQGRSGGFLPGQTFPQGNYVYGHGSGTPPRNDGYSPDQKAFGNVYPENNSHETNRGSFNPVTSNNNGFTLPNPNVASTPDRNELFPQNQYGTPNNNGFQQKNVPTMSGSEPGLQQQPGSLWSLASGPYPGLGGNNVFCCTVPNNAPNANQHPNAYGPNVAISTSPMGNSGVPNNFMNSGQYIPGKVNPPNIPGSYYGHIGGAQPNMANRYGTAEPSQSTGSEGYYPGGRGGYSQGVNPNVNHVPFSSGPFNGQGETYYTPSGTSLPSGPYGNDNQRLPLNHFSTNLPHGQGAQVSPIAEHPYGSGRTPGRPDGQGTDRSSMPGGPYSGTAGAPNRYSVPQDTYGSSSVSQPDRQGTQIGSFPGGPNNSGTLNRPNGQNTYVNPISGVQYGSGQGPQISSSPQELYGGRGPYSTGSWHEPSTSSGTTGTGGPYGTNIPGTANVQDTRFNAGSRTPYPSGTLGDVNGYDPRLGSSINRHYEPGTATGPNGPSMSYGTHAPGGLGPDGLAYGSGPNRIGGPYGPISPDLTSVPYGNKNAGGPDFTKEYGSGHMPGTDESKKQVPTRLDGFNGPNGVQYSPGAPGAMGNSGRPYQYDGTNNFLPGVENMGKAVSPYGPTAYGSDSTGKGPNGPSPYGYNSQGGMGPSKETDVPQNYINPASASPDDDDSKAEASVGQAVNGTTASASSHGGNSKERAQATVHGTYTGSGSFQAQAQITGDNKGAESEVSGDKKGASSSASGNGRNNKSQANVQLGSETGAVQTQSQANGVMHSSNSQVQGSVKGGMADAQARGPGSTSSQAQIGFTPYKDNDKSSHDKQTTAFVGGGLASAQSSGRIGQSQSQLHGTFKYGITYNGAAQSGASLDKDAVFPNRISFDKIDVFDEKERIINTTELTESLDIKTNSQEPSTETVPFNIRTTDENINDEIVKKPENEYPDHTHSDHHKTDDTDNTSEPTILSNKSFQPTNYTTNNIDYDSMFNGDKDQPEEYEIDSGYVLDGNESFAEPNEYSNYDEYTKDAQTHESIQSPRHKGLEIKQTTGGNTQHILLDSLKNHDAKITQKNSERPDESRTYQPGERIPGTGGYMIPLGFTGSVKSVASKDSTYVVGSKNSPSQAQSVTLTPGTGTIKYHHRHPNSFGKFVNPKDLKNLNNDNDNDDRYVSVSKSVTRDLDSENNIKKQYSHTYYTKSSSCGYFTFTCTMVSSAEGRKKVCKPKMPTNPDGTPIRC